MPEGTCSRVWTGRKAQGGLRKLLRQLHQVGNKTVRPRLCSRAEQAVVGNDQVDRLLIRQY